MRTFRISNLGQPRPRVFGPLTPETIERLCDAVDAYNNAESSPEGGRAIRDAIADVQSILGPMSLTNKRAAAAQIRILCNNAASILSKVMPPEPASFPFYTPPPPAPPVMSIHSPTQPPKSKDVATGQPGPGRGQFGGWRKSVATPATVSLPEPVPPTGSEETDIFPEPFEVASRNENPYSQPPQAPPAMPTQRPAVATPSAGCWYTAGKGYSYGAYPGAGAELVPLNASDCQALVARDREVRGLPTQTPGQTQQQAQYQQPQQTTSYSGPGAFNQTQRQDVASQDCGPGRFWDGVKCRGSVDASAANLINSAASMGPSGGMTANSGGINAGGYGGGYTSYSMGRRFPVKNI